MRHTKKAFTMIELIFVIVILGILAAVAIPKLSATRDDAKVSKMATNLNTLISDVGMNYTAVGSLDKWLDITNVIIMTSATAEAIATTKVTSPVYLYSDDKQCIKLVATVNGSLTISEGSDKTDLVCAAVLKTQKNNLKTFSFGGTGIKY